MSTFFFFACVHLVTALRSIPLLESQSFFSTIQSHIFPSHRNLSQVYRPVLPYPKEFRIQIDRYILILERENTAYAIFHNIPTGPCVHVR